MKAAAHSLGVGDGKCFRLNLDLSMADLENLQQIRRDLRSAARDLQLDLDTINAVETHGTARTAPAARSAVGAQIANELERAKALTISLDDTAGLVISQNLCGLSALADKYQVRTVLERHQSDKATEMARLAAIDTFVMRELSRKAQRDSRTLKVITIVAMLYLPASFVSVSMTNAIGPCHFSNGSTMQTLLSMNYIHITNKHPYVLKIDREFLVFVVLTVCFLCVTIGVWLGFELRARRLDRADNALRIDGQEKLAQEV